METHDGDAGDERTRLEALAAAIADGTVLDWADADGALADDEARKIAHNLQVIASMSVLSSGSRDIGSSTSRAPSDTRPTRLTPGTSWGSLRIVDHLGAGRFGDVYRAFDPALDREVALKLVRDDDADSDVVAEGRLMARVRHPNVATIYGAQRIDGVSGLWMELVDGHTLEAELAESGLFDSATLIDVGVELAHALDAVHQAQLVHRDVKAQNVLRERSGRIVLGDFGIGRDLKQTDGDRGGLAGTPAYLAPEHFTGGATTPASDIYSLGTLLFHLATARYPVPGSSLAELRQAHTRQERTPLIALRPDLPSDLINVVETALESEPARRFPRARVMARALAACTASPTPASRRLTLAASVMALIVAVAAFGDPASARVGVPVLAGGARPTVLIAAFENATGDSRLDGTIEFALERDLSIGQSVHVASRFRVQDSLALMRRPPDARLDLDVAREVALRDGGIQALVTGRIGRRGTGFRLDAEIRHPVDGRILAGLGETARAETEILEVVGRLARAVRRRMGETMAELQASGASPLPRLTTSSLRALQIYAQVTRMQNDEGLFYGGEEAAERLLKEAIAEDPEFAAAHRLLAIVVRLGSSWAPDRTERLTEALAHMDRAVALSATVSPAERIQNEYQRHVVLFLMTQGPEATEQARRAIAGCEALLAMVPDHEEAAIACINLYAGTQQYNERLVTRLADQRPRAPQWQVAAAEAILAADEGAIDRAKPFMRRAALLEPTGTASAEAVAAARLFAAREAWLANRVEDALQISDALAADMASRSADVQIGAARQLWPMYLDLGRFRQAEALASRVEHSRGRRYALSSIATYREDKAQLRELLTRLWPQQQELFNFATPFIEAGMVPESRRLLAMHRSQQAGPPEYRAQYLRMLEGGVALIEGKPRRAIEPFEQFLANRNVSVHRSREARVRRWLADAWVAQRKVASAIAVLEATAPRQVGDWAGADWLQNREYLARLYRQVGRISEAQAIEVELVTLLAVADEDHPIKRRLSAR
jgi:tetratricopeptide (TPR) repeat protein